MNMKKFSTVNEEKRKMIKVFHEILNTIDKDTIMEAFKEGFKLGVFDKIMPNGSKIKRRPEDDLYLQFNDERRFVYTIVRMPIKRQQKQNIIEKAINNG